MANITSVNSRTHLLGELQVRGCAFAALPQEIMNKILQMLSLKDISACSLLSKDIRLMTTDSALWMSLSLRDFPGNSRAQDFSIETYDDCYRCRSNLFKG